ncbi:IS110 family transposase [Bacillus sp. H-16]|uniref:IS110 family transposase n=1 Tax=Alteribacter salitolerans TaxID=2912333 RepID=UPI0019650BA8|nr:IS110 family transposase [Alteribacter salitolerans]MBM7098054.1 IS110 family transposase [Alteribacter salitolerans]
MHHNRNYKINQVTESTLVIGVDIAKKTHYACPIDYRGRELQKAFRIQQSNHGFETFYSAIKALMAEFNKTNILIGFEPTGHYWMNLAAFLEERDIPFVLVNPLNVKRSKEFDDNTQSKNDKKDARVIAKLIPNGSFSIPRKMSETESELRRGAAFRNRLKDEVASIKNRIQRWIDLYFPEFSSVFKSLGEHARASLRCTPLPDDIRSGSPEDLLKIYRESGARYASLKRTEKLFEAAKYSIGVKDGSAMARMEINALLDQLEIYEAQVTEITHSLIELARTLPDFIHLTSISGVSETTIVELLAETGSLKHYKHPRQLIKLAGLALRDNSSGKYEGKRQLSKRGRRRLRALLYKSMLPLIHNNTAFCELYEYYISRKENPLKKKEALVALCRKLLQVFHGLSKNSTMFDGERMKQDLSNSTLSNVA